MDALTLWVQTRLYKAALIRGLLQGSGRKYESILGFPAYLGKELGLEKIIKLDKLGLNRMANCTGVWGLRGRS